MEIDDIHLAPCPFCGGAARFDGWPVDYVECERCKASGPIAENTASSLSYDDQMRNAQRLADLWNSRRPIA